MNDMEKETSKSKPEASLITEHDNSLDDVSELTYEDYLSAVYTYQDKLVEKKECEAEIGRMFKVTEKSKKMLDDTTKAIDDNRSKRRKVHDLAIAQQKAVWKSKQDRLDVKISQESGRAKDEAQAEKDKRAAELKKSEEDFKKKKQEVESREKYLGQEHVDLQHTREFLDDYHADDVPVADESVLELLELAEEKGLMTPHYKALLNMKTSEVCKKRITDVEDLLKQESEFASSECVKKLKEGKVTRKVIKEFSVVAAAVFLVITYAFSLMSGSVSVNNPFSFVLSLTCAGISTVFVGGVLMTIVEVIGKKYWFEDEMTMQDRSLLIAVLVIGMIGGFLIWLFLLYGRTGIFNNVYYLISAIGASLIFKRFLNLEICEKLLGKLPFLKNRARHFVFKAAENTEADLQIYCYMNHSAVLQYLSIVIRDRLLKQNKNKIELNDNLQIHNKKEQDELSEQAEKLERLRKDIEELNKKTDEQLAERLKKIKAQRGETKNPDFEGLLPKKVVEELNSLDEEHKALSKTRLEQEQAAKKYEDKFNALADKHTAICEKTELIERAMHDWNSSPFPSQSSFKIHPVICLESNKKYVILRHNLKATELKYPGKSPEMSPMSVLENTIYRYIKGLLKINPKSMLQINIVDPVSHPDILQYSEKFSRLCPKGIANGVRAVNGFDLRLFTEESDFESFNMLFGKKTDELQDFLLKNYDKISDEKSRSVETANAIKQDDKKPFVYQVMIFVVPRAYDDTDFLPPPYILKSIKDKTYFKKGILPIFFADKDSVHPSWEGILDNCEMSFLIGGGRKRERKTQS